MLLAVAAVLNAGCSVTETAFTSPTPVAPPDAAARPAMLTVRVHERTSEVPIAGAFVLYQGTSASTDRTGQVVFEVERGEETTIDVSAQGYEPLSASGVLGGDERWTFYLRTSSVE